jgi:2,4'-dihydroxyacetophenone dioxygenase
VWFQMYGANINLDAEGNITSVVDGPMTLEFYLAVCADLGLPRPNVLVD